MLTSHNDLENAAGFCGPYIPQDEPLTVRELINGGFWIALLAAVGLVGLVALISGVTCLTGLACIAFGG